MNNIIERNKTNENQENKNLDAHSYILIKNKNYISSIKDEDNNKIIIGSRNGNKDESNNYFYESNLIFNMTDNIFNHAHTNEEKKSQKFSESTPAEELFIKQKDKIKFYKEINKKENKNVYKSDIIINQKIERIKKEVTLDDFQFFEKSLFYYNNKGSKIKDHIIPKFKNNSWEKLIESLKNFELKNIALRTLFDIDYEKNMSKIYINFTLKDESELWISTRSFLKNELNKSSNFDGSSMNLENEKIFDKYSSLIKIIKRKYHYITFGTFCESSKHSKQLNYKSFLKRQLVNFNENCYLNNETEYDICQFNMYIIDKGDDSIDVKISINSDNKYNQIIAQFYLPINKKSKLLFCGKGDSVVIKDLKINNINKNEEQKDEFETLFTLEQKSCNCCSII